MWAAPDESGNFQHYRLCHQLQSAQEEVFLADALDFLRLREQLWWAHEGGFLADALDFLNSLKPDQWNHSAPEKWTQSSYCELH